MKNNKPSFFIVGAPKCGTTALANYLSEHRNIFFSPLKEPNYFATDFHRKMRPVSKKNKYLSLFENAGKNQLCGEGSIWYLYSKNAIKNIRNFDFNSKIIIMIRNPADMIYSLHNQKINSKDEDVYNFERAFKLSWQREKGFYVPQKCKEKTTLYYHKIANYYEQLKNVYKFFPKKQVKVILYDDFIKNNLKIYKEVLKFLNIKYDKKVSFKKINVSYSERSRIIGTFIKRPPKFIANIANFAKKFGIKVYDIQKLLIRLNTLYEDRKPLDNKMRIIINNHYKKSTMKLFDILKNKKIKKWLEVK